MTEQSKSGLLLTRVFNAPRELVFKVWTDPEHFGKWWGPQGFSLDVVRMDVRPGGMFLGCQKSPDGTQAMWGCKVALSTQLQKNKQLLMVWLQW
jgi:uncharacterized protein YndB with AHSA1/START domain